jgi:hypothetical protein
VSDGEELIGKSSTAKSLAALVSTARWLWWFRVTMKYLTMFRR